MKQCGRCGEWKELSQFLVRNVRTGNRKWCCNACSALYCREHYRRNKPRYIELKRARQRRYWRRDRAIVIDYLKAHPCVDCGEADILVLEFDHVLGVKEKDVSAIIGRASPRALSKEIEKCVVRCANCHRRKTAKERGWFKWINALGEN